MKDNEKRLSRYIDELNAGIMPKDHKNMIDDEEYKKLLETVRKVRVLRGAQYPDDSFQKRLVGTLKGQRLHRENELLGRNKLLSENKFSSEKSLPRVKKLPRERKRAKIIRRALTFTAAAAVLLFVSLNFVLPGRQTDIVYAMEKAIQGIRAYHGIVEITETNGLGETMMQSRREVWADQDGNYYVRELEGFSKGLVTVNNGQQKWQISPEEAAVYKFNTFPDPYRFTFELGSEIDDVKKALTVESIGEDTVSGREAVILKVTPDGGEPYQLWIDKETDLPLQKQTAMQNALQYKVSYTSIDFADSIPRELLAYSVPAGFEEVDKDQEQIVTSLEEAKSIAGFSPVIPDTVPGGYSLDKIAVEKEQSAIKLYYNTADRKNTVVLRQSKAAGELAAASNAVLGTVNDNKAEILAAAAAPSLRWQEQGMEYSVLGNSTLEELSAFAGAFSGGEVFIPEAEAVTENKPQIEVPVDLEAEENEQKSVDAGHSPWKLDPAFVAQVFASLLLSPEGIVGDYPISYEDIVITENNGTDAKAEIKDEKSIAGYVYLKRLIRQDDTGIWTVVGYDPAK
jgi:outer membrane lipoprotein-sorting protein